MNIIEININELTHYENNAKIHTKEQIEQIKSSILKFGNNDPIGIWGDKNIIVEGHGRAIALKELGYETVDCIRLDHLTDEERKAYTLIHNKTTMNTDFDFDKLEEELMSIQNIDMTEFEFEEELFDEIGKEFSDIPEEVELEKNSDDGEKININYLQFDGKKIALTDGELIKLNDKYEFYLEIHKTNFGFVNYLLGSEKDEI